MSAAARGASEAVSKGEGWWIGYAWAGGKTGQAWLARPVDEAGRSPVRLEHGDKTSNYDCHVNASCKCTRALARAGRPSDAPGRSEARRNPNACF